MTEEKSQKGILSFFQNVPKSKKEKVAIIDLEEDMKSDGLDDQKENILQEEDVSSPKENHSSQDKNSDEKKVQRETEKKMKEQLRLEEKLQREKKKEEEKRKREEEKRLKEIQREEEKRKREEEKRLKEIQREEEKKRKEQLKEEERKKREKQKEEERKKKEQLKLQREEEKRQREEEKRKLEEEKKQKEEAKERAQSRIGNFFRKVADDGAKPVQVKTDYERFFLPFYAKDSVKVYKGWKLSEKELEQNKQSIDSLLKSDKTSASDLDPVNWLQMRKVPKRGHPIKLTAVSLLQQMTAKEKSDEELQQLLALVPHKYIKFYENVRPPYIGTYSKEFELPVENPFNTEITGFNYDYDSDLEWVNEEDEEGDEVDNLESGDEDEEEEEDMASEGEFDGFLDTEDGDGNLKNSSKKKFVGPLIPIVQLRIDIDKLDDDDRQYFKKVSAVSLSEQNQFPIDPHYIPAPSASPKKLSQLASNEKKRPLDQDSSDVSTPSESPNKKSKAIITEATDLLKLFNEVQDSTFSLATITEIVQKNLPQYNKQTVKNTVKHYAVRLTGKTNEDRKWVIKDKEHWDSLQNQV